MDLVELVKRSPDHSVEDLPNVTQVGENRWEVRVTYTKQPSGKRQEMRRRVQGDVHDAMEVRAKLKMDARQGRPSSADPDTATVEGLYDRFDELRQGRGRWSVADSTYDHAKSVYERKILPIIGTWRVADIQRSDLTQVIEYWAEMEKQRGEGKYSAHTVNKWIREMRVLLKFCFERIDRDPGVLTDLRGIPTTGTKKRGRSLSKSERDLFLETARDVVPEHYALMHTLLTTGQRWGSVSALRWQDLDWSTGEFGTLHFERSQHQGSVKRGSKTGRQISLPLTENLADALRIHEERFRGTDDHAGFRTTDLIFPARTVASKAARNGFMGPDTGRGICHTICDEAGISPKVTPHDLRRTMVTLALESGMTPEQVKSITGHCRAMIDHYNHVTDDGRRAILEAVDGSGSE